MKTIVHIVVAAIFGNIVGGVEQKQVNIALETVLQFGKKDPADGLAVIDKVQNALQNIKRGIELRNGRRMDRNDITFTDFISDAANILKDFNDNDLEDIFVVISEETNRYIDREGELQKWFGRGNLRRQLNKRFDTLKDMQAETLRQYLDAAITAVENKKYGEEKNDLLDIGNFLYMGGNHKLKAALRHLEMLKRSSDLHLEDVARDTLKFLFFDHFSNLNNNIKREVIKMANDYLKIHQNRVNKKPRSTTLDPREADGYTHITEEHEENRVDVKDEIRHKRKGRPVPRIKKNSNIHTHKNKRYKSYKSRTQKDRRATTPIVYKFKVKPRKVRLSASKKKRIPLYRPKTDKIISFENSLDKKPEKVTRKNILKKNTQTKLPTFLKQHSRKPKTSLNSNSMLLTGGQKMHAIDLRGLTSSSQETDEKQDKTKEQQAPQDIATGGKLHTGAYLSVERFLSRKKTTNWKVIKEEERTLTITNISDEGLSIEGFENERNIRDKVMRKYLKNDTLQIDTQGGNMTKMIENIEKKIENVKEQFDLVKNLTADTDETSHNLTFRASHSHKKSSKQKNEGKRKHYYPPKNSDSIERDNEDFFLRDSSERIIINEANAIPNLEFRNHDADFTVTHSAVTKVIQNITTKTSTKNTSKMTTANSKTTVVNINKANKTNKTKEDIVKNTTVVNNKKTLHNTTKHKANKNATQVFITNGNIKTTKPNTPLYLKIKKTTTVEMKLNETIINNTTEVTKDFESHYTFNPLLVDNMFH